MNKITETGKNNPITELFRKVVYGGYMPKIWIIMCTDLQFVIDALIAMSED